VSKRTRKAKFERSRSLITRSLIKWEARN